MNRGVQMGAEGVGEEADEVAVCGVMPAGFSTNSMAELSVFADAFVSGCVVLSANGYLQMGVMLYTATVVISCLL